MIGDGDSFNIIGKARLDDGRVVVGLVLEGGLLAMAAVIGERVYLKSAAVEPRTVRLFQRLAEDVRSCFITFHHSRPRLPILVFSLGSVDVSSQPQKYRRKR